MKEEHKRALILFAVLAILAVIVWGFHPTFGKGLLMGLGFAALIYILRSFLPRRQ